MKQGVLTILTRLGFCKKEPDLTERLQKFLGKDGIHFFWTLIRLYGTPNAIIRTKGLIPSHPVHFREGMTIRNWLRDQPECKDWDHNRLDCDWSKLVKQAVLAAKGEGKCARN